jgi:hypothetical protein
MKQFEYKLMTPTNLKRSGRSHTLQAGLDKMGKEGWELVGMFDGYFTFKRQPPGRKQ